SKRASANGSSNPYPWCISASGSLALAFAIEEWLMSIPAKLMCGYDRRHCARSSPVLHPTSSNEVMSSEIQDMGSILLCCFNLIVDCNLLLAMILLPFFSASTVLILETPHGFSCSVERLTATPATLASRAAGLENRSSRLTRRS